MTKFERVRSDRQSRQMLVPLDPQQVRANLVALANKSGASLSSLSRMIGKNEAYLQQFVKRGTPAKLDEADRLKLAQFFGCDERRLGARDPWRPKC